MSDLLYCAKNRHFLFILLKLCHIMMLVSLQCRTALVIFCLVFFASYYISNAFWELIWSAYFFNVHICAELLMLFYLQTPKFCKSYESHLLGKKNDLYKCSVCVQGEGSNVLNVAALELTWIYAVLLVTPPINSSPTWWILWLSWWVSY